MMPSATSCQSFATTVPVGDICKTPRASPGLMRYERKAGVANAVYPSFQTAASVSHCEFPETVQALLPETGSVMMWVASLPVIHRRQPTPRALGALAGRVD